MATYLCCVKKYFTMWHTRCDINNFEVVGTKKYNVFSVASHGCLSVTVQNCVAKVLEFIFICLRDTLHLKSEDVYLQAWFCDIITSFLANRGPVCVMWKPDNKLDLSLVRQQWNFHVGMSSGSTFEMNIFIFIDCGFFRERGGIDIHLISVARVARSDTNYCSKQSSLYTFCIWLLK